MKPRHIFLLAGMLLSASGVTAQFSMNTVGHNTELSVPLPVNRGRIDAGVINATEARVLRKALWRQRNLADFSIKFMGNVTQYNKSWTTNNQNVVSGELYAHYYHTYNRGRHTSIFKFDGSYGMNHFDDTWFKNRDELKLYYLASWAIKKEGFLRNWSYSSETLFVSQFSEGVKSRTDKTPWSNFMAPGTFDSSLGFKFTSPDVKLPFIVVVSPISGRALFVTDDRIDPDRRAKLGIPVTWIPDPTPDNPDNKRPEFKNYKLEGGSKLSVSFDRTFALRKKKDGLSLRYIMTFNTFYGWVTQIWRHDPMNSMQRIVPTADWVNTLSLKPLKFLTLDFKTTLHYDKSQVDKVQMQYFLSVGLTYGYKNK